MQIEWEDARGLAERRFEREQGRHDAAEDLSELSEGEKEKGDTSQSEMPKDKISRINSVMQMWSDENKSKHLYIVLIRYFFLFLLPREFSYLCETKKYKIRNKWFRVV